MQKAVKIAGKHERTVILLWTFATVTNPQPFLSCLWIQFNSIQFNSILLVYLDITYNNLILTHNVVQTRDDETNNILCTTRHTGHIWKVLGTNVKIKIWCDEFLHNMYR